MQHEARSEAERLAQRSEATAGGSRPNPHQRARESEWTDATDPYYEHRGIRFQRFPRDPTNADGKTFNPNTGALDQTAWRSLDQYRAEQAESQG